MRWLTERGRCQTVFFRINRPLTAGRLFAVADSSSEPAAGAFPAPRRVAAVETTTTTTSRCKNDVESAFLVSSPGRHSMELPNHRRRSCQVFLEQQQKRCSAAFSMPPAFTSPRTNILWRRRNLMPPFVGREMCRRRTWRRTGHRRKAMIQQVVT